MTSHTRISRVMSSPPGPRQSNLSTMMFGAPAPAPTGLDLYLRVHRLLRSAALEETRPGAFIFAVQSSGVLVGRLWLSATAEVRAATLGRHEVVDLPITPEATFSLRHLLFVVRLVKGRVRFTALDLDSRNGLHTSVGEQRVLEAERPAALRTAGLAFFCVPTGPGAVFPEEPLAAWNLFERPPPAKPRASIVDRFLSGQVGLAGALTARLGPNILQVSVDETALERGVLLGRDERCDVTVPDREVSRVHAVLLSVDGVPHLIDTGSSNGTWRGPTERVRCEPLEPGGAFQLGSAVFGWRPLG